MRTAGGKSARPARRWPRLPPSETPQCMLFARPWAPYRLYRRYTERSMAFRRSFADQAVKTSRLPAFRAEHFPYSGPYPWLDRDDAMDEIERRLQRNEISETDAGFCRCWAANGYVILNNLIESP